MKSLIACVIACLLTLFLGCSPRENIYHDVTYDYDVAVDFDRIKTYNWVKMPATSRLDEFNQVRIKKIVNAKLESQGLMVQIDNPDVFPFNSQQAFFLELAERSTDRLQGKPQVVGYVSTTHG